MKIKIDKRILALAAIFVILFAGVLFYYFGMIYVQDSKIAQLNTQKQNLNHEVTSLSSQISNLTNQITNLSTANLTASLAITEMLYTGASTQPNAAPYNYLTIQGSVNNTGQGTAYNAGLHVIAYAADGALEINMTVPMVDGGTFAADNQIANNPLVLPLSPVTLPQFEDLYDNVYANENTAISIVIYHEGMVSNWTATPVWSNTP